MNLLVGANNCGKTSILESIQLLRSPGNPYVLSSIAGRRGEWGYASERDVPGQLGTRSEFLDYSHLFSNHQFHRSINIEAERIAEGTASSWNDKVTVSVDERLQIQQQALDAALLEDNEESPVLRVRWSDAEIGYKATVNEEGFLLGSRSPAHIRSSFTQAAPFIRTSGMTSTDVVRTFSKFVLTPKHEAIKEALRIVEPTIEDLVPIADGRNHFDRNAPGGVVLRLHGVENRVPIGSMGDGTWRMLGLALSVACAEGGVLLVDEIDTGLHYSILEDMWRMLSKEAEARSVQLFATTYSRDCYESLAAIAVSAADSVTIQRIDRSRSEAVRFSSEAIVAAAERGLEVR